MLDSISCSYACYHRRMGEPAFFQANCNRFPSASVIKVPILLAWTRLERAGVVSRFELCDLNAEPEVQGSGFSWLLQARSLPYHDVLLLMIALSDNLCTNLVIRRAGMERLNRVFQDELGLAGTQLQRKMMDLEARQQGRDNWITPEDCIRMFDLIADLRPEERAWVEPLLLANQDDALLARDLPRDTVSFYHKTGGLPDVMHDWGYTDRHQLFLLTWGCADKPALYPAFGSLGRRMLA